MRFVLTRDPAEFATRADGLFARRLDCNILATVSMNVRDGAFPDAAPLFAYAVAGDGEVQFAALRVPPWPLLVCGLDAGLADRLVGLWLVADPDVPGVSGPPETVRAIGAAWARRSRGVTRRRMEEAMHVLDAVRDPPHPATGDLRRAQPGERPLLVIWMADFAREAGVPGADRAEAVVDGWLRRGGLWIWDDAGAVSMLGITRPVAGVVRIGPVYTPPAHRGRGYAGNAVAAAGRWALAHGAERCLLFTDLANPTSNKIYAEVGFRRVGDWEEHAFEPGG